MNKTKVALISSLLTSSLSGVAFADSGVVDCGYKEEIELDNCKVEVSLRCNDHTTGEVSYFANEEFMQYQMYVEADDEYCADFGEGTANKFEHKCKEDKLVAKLELKRKGNCMLPE